MIKDSEKHNHALATQLLSLEGENAVDFELKEILNSHLQQNGGGKWLGMRSIADASELSDLFVFYRELSADAHPTMNSLLKYIQVDGDLIDFVWGPERNIGGVKEVLLLSCTFLIASGLAFNFEVAKDEVMGEELGSHWSAVQALNGN